MTSRACDEQIAPNDSESRAVLSGPADAGV